MLARPWGTHALSGVVMVIVREVSSSREVRLQLEQRKYIWGLLTLRLCRNRGFQLWSSKRIPQTSTCRLSSNRSYEERQVIGCAAEKFSIIRPSVRKNEGITSAPPPYHFLASLFLDGRQKADSQAIVYLDPLNEYFASPYGKIKLQCR